MRRCVLLVAVLTAIGLPSLAQVGTPSDTLYQALLKGKPAPLPSGYTGIVVTAPPLGAPEKTAKMTGAVQGQLQGGDPKAQFVIFVFASENDALGYYNAHLALPPNIGKMIAYPPLAQCADINSVGYCEMYLQGRATILTSTATKASPGADSVLGVAYQYVQSTEQAIARATPTPVVTPGGMDACALLTTAEIQAALNEPVKDGQRDGNGGCTWHAQGSDMLSLAPQPNGQAGYAAAQAHTANSATFSGIGDAAFAFVSPAGFIQVFLIKSGHYVNFTLQSTSKSALQIAQGLAVKVAGRL